MNFFTKLAAIGVIAGSAVFSSGAQAGPSDTVTSNGGTVRLTFVGFRALDNDQLTLTFNGTTIFDNKATTPGSFFDFGPVADGTEIPFFLRNVSQGTFYQTGTVNASVEDTIAPFGALLNPTSNAVAAGLVGANTVFVGFEDRSGTGADFDYNDLIFAVTSGGDPVTVPEPATLALLGAGLLGLGAARRGRKTA